MPTGGNLSCLLGRRRVAPSARYGRGTKMADPSEAGLLRGCLWAGRCRRFHGLALKTGQNLAIGVLPGAFACLPCAASLRRGASSLITSVSPVRHNLQYAVQIARIRHQKSSPS